MLEEDSDEYISNSNIRKENLKGLSYSIMKSDKIPKDIDSKIAVGSYDSMKNLDKNVEKTQKPELQFKNKN